MHRIREFQALALMVLGVVMLARGVGHSFRNGIDPASLLMSVFVGALVFALGYARWRYWRQR